MLKSTYMCRYTFLSQDKLQNANTGKLKKDKSMAISFSILQIILNFRRKLFHICYSQSGEKSSSSQSIFKTSYLENRHPKTVRAPTKKSG